MPQFKHRPIPLLREKQITRFGRRLISEGRMNAGRGRVIVCLPDTAMSVLNVCCTLPRA